MINDFRCIWGSSARYTPAEQAISPQKPINRLLKTDWYNGTTLMSNEPPCIVGDSTFWENTTMKTRHYTPEIKDRAVRMLIEALSDYPSTWSAIQAIAPKIGCTPETLRSWHKKHIDQTIPASVQAQSQEQRIKELERENKELKQANEIIRKAAGLEAQAEKGRPPR